MTKTDIDLELQIHSELSSIQSKGISIKIQHVKGHQDDNQAYHELSRATQLNVKADALASEAHIDIPSPKYYEMPTTVAHLLLDGVHITADLAGQLREAYTS
jgi:hypothetical protein